MNIADVALGTRVSVRARADDGWLNDAVGELVERANGAIVINTRKGPKVVEVARIVAWRIVPERPPRPGRPVFPGEG